MADQPYWLVAAESFTLERDGKPLSFTQNESRVMSDNPVLEGIRHLFKPLEATVYDVEAASAAPGERRGA